MATTPEEAAQQSAAIRKALQELNSAAEAYMKISEQNVGKKDLSYIGEVSEAQVELATTIRKIDRTVRGPVGMIWGHLDTVQLYQNSHQPLHFILINI